MASSVEATARWAAAVRAVETARDDRLFADPWAAALAGPDGMAWFAGRPPGSTLPIAIRPATSTIGRAWSPSMPDVTVDEALGGVQATAEAPWVGAMDDPVSELAVRRWTATVTQPGSPEANHGRRTLPVALPRRELPDVVDVGPIRRPLRRGSAMVLP